MIARQAAGEPADSGHWATIHQVPVVLVLLNERFDVDFLEQVLAGFGFSVGGAFCKNQDAQEWLEVCNPDVAVIDAEVQDGDCREVAQMLHARGVPFVVYSTAAARGRATDAILKTGIFLKKPSSRPRILAAVREALVQREGN